MRRFKVLRPFFATETGKYYARGEIVSTEAFSPKVLEEWEHDERIRVLTGPTGVVIAGTEAARHLASKYGHVLCLLLLVACTHRPVVDPGRTDMNKYEADLADCQRVADSQPGAGTGAAVGAAAGIVLGEVLGRTSGTMRQRGHMSGTGAVMGGIAGASAGATKQRQIINNCLRGRGHNVLD